MAEVDETGSQAKSRPTEPAVRRRSRPSRSAGASGRRRTPRAYELCDGGTEGLLYFMVVFSPWAFGTTQPWSIWVMNVAAYLTGILLITKWAIRFAMAYTPPRWGVEAHPAWRRLGRWTSEEIGRFLTRALAVLTLFMLLYCLTSAWNARSDYLEGYSSFKYFDHSIAWLPHSRDAGSTWFAFWQYLGLAFVFWAARDWLLGKTRKERRSGRGDERQSATPESEEGRARGPAAYEAPTDVAGLPERLTRLLWVLCVNAGLVALVGILQRVDGSNRLLWTIEPYFNDTAMSQFGPYAYRANAAQYFNLVWPLCLGFWWVLSRRGTRPSTSARIGQGAHVMLLPLTVLIAAAPFITTSRGGAAIAVVAILGAGALLIMANRGARWTTHLSVLTVLTAIIGFGLYLGWGYFEKRLENIHLLETSRWTIYKTASKMIEDFPLYGTGPGTFGDLYHMYRDDTGIKKSAYAHDDWLETRVTFGLVGLTAILLMFGIVLAHYFLGQGVRLNPIFVGMLALAIGGCVAHAKFDFPFQIHSLLFLFLLECAILFSASHARAD